jgi:hypothetical protein
MMNNAGAIRSIAIAASVIAINLCAHAQPISPYLVGNNAWLELNDAVWKKAAECGLQHVRIGGEGYDGNLPGATGDWVNKITAMGAQPIIQIPQNASPDAAANIVRQYPKVIFYNIGNEPNLALFGAVSVDVVANYVRSKASAMKKVNPKIKIYVADCAWYDAAFYPAMFGGNNDVSGKDADGNYYVDGISWHKYPYGAEGAQHGQVNTRFVAAMRTDIIACKKQVELANEKHSRTGENAIGWGIGEFNAVDGNDVHSFENGQMHGCVLGLTMKYEGTYASSWSMYENGGNHGETDFSYLDGNGLTPRASYRHMEMIAKNFSGDFFDATGANGVGSTTDIFAFGCKDVAKDKVCAMIINRGTAQYTYSLRFDDTNITAGQEKINFSADVDGEYSDVIAGKSTIMLVFSSTAGKKYTYTATHFSQGKAPDVSDIKSPFPNIRAVMPTLAHRAPSKEAFALRMCGRALEITFPQSQSYTVEVVNMNGRKVASYCGTGFLARLSNDALLTGTYCLRLTTSDGTFLRRFMIM